MAQRLTIFDDPAANQDSLDEILGSLVKPRRPPVDNPVSYPQADENCHGQAHRSRHILAA